MFRVGMVQQGFTGFQQWTKNVSYQLSFPFCQALMAMGNHPLVDDLPRKNVIAVLDSQWDFSLRFGR